MQNLRSSLQKYLKGQLSTTGATFTRFAYAAPLALLYLWAVQYVGDYELPAVSGEFLTYAMVGGLSQIIATGLLVYLFSFRNFAVGTTFSKTETVQTALFGIVVLGETISFGATAGIVVSLFGVMMISMTNVSANPRDILRQCLELPALIGIASGAFFGISAVAYRAGALSLDSGHFTVRAAFCSRILTGAGTADVSLPSTVTLIVIVWGTSAGT